MTINIKKGNKSFTSKDSQPYDSSIKHIRAAIDSLASECDNCENEDRRQVIIEAMANLSVILFDLT